MKISRNKAKYTFKAKKDFKKIVHNFMSHPKTSQNLFKLLEQMTSDH